MFAGCSSKNEPSVGVLRDKIRADLPPYLEVTKVETDVIKTGAAAVKVNFKLTVASKETLFQTVGKIDGTPVIALLRPVQESGTGQTVYGSVEANRIVDSWEFGRIEFQSGMEQFGRPKGAYGPNALIENSPEATAETKRRVAAAKEARREEQDRLARAEAERKALVEKQEAQRKALEEQEKQANEAEKRKLLDATAAGTAYTGILAWKDQRQRLRLVFTGQNGFVVNAVISNMDNPDHRQNLVGEITVKPGKKPDTKFEKAYPIILTSDKRTGRQEGKWDIYAEACRVGVELSVAGFEGEAIAAAVFGEIRYTIRLKRETAEDIEKERRDKETAAQRKSKEDEERERELTKEEDRAKGVPRDPNTGMLSANSAFIRNASKRKAVIQLLKEEGWEEMTIMPGETAYLLSNCVLRIRWKEGDKMKRSPIYQFNQPYLESAGVNPDSMKRNAPMNILKIDDDGKFSFSQPGQP